MTAFLLLPRLDHFSLERKKILPGSAYLPDQERKWSTTFVLRMNDFVVS